MRLPFHRQLDSYDCGPSCLSMVSKYYGRHFDLEFLRDECYLTREGVSLLGVNQGAEKIGFRTLMVKTTSEVLLEDCPLPAILHWNHLHFVVLYNIKKRFNIFGKRSLIYTIADPAHGILKLSEADFSKYWQKSENQGIALLLEPTDAFYKNKSSVRKKNSATFLLSHLRPFKKQLIWLFVVMVLSLGVTLLLPYLTKGLIDIGVNQKSYYWIGAIISLQLILYIAGSALDVIRGWVLLHVNSKISLNIVSDFLKKLLRLPIRFFDSKSVGDVSQRIADHRRIEAFLTGETITSLFSVLQIIVFSFVLLSYDMNIWVIFSAFSALGILWIFLFKKKRNQLDYVRFIQNKNTQEKLFELIIGMQEIKLFGRETVSRWEWESLQKKQYKLNIKTLKLEQFQQIGFLLLSYIKNVLISYLAAVAVLNGEMSLGIMLSISFIIGQTNGPLQQLVQFFKTAQDAKLSLSRLQEVHNKTDEDKENGQYKTVSNVKMQDIILNNLSFQYQGPRSPFVLRDVNLTFPKKSVTAIVGESGSGKTTLLKLLLGFYAPTEGKIMIGSNPLSEITPTTWRGNCGTVMQDGYIFSDTILKNIVMDGENVDTRRLESAIAVSNVAEFVNDLPLKYNTKIGTSGLGLSGGQKQRILIARAIYKEPAYLFFDEATSSLDANNETSIMNALEKATLGKTVIIIAHRLSTVKKADQIIVLEKGQIVEIGDHPSLSKSKGKYYNLVKNQLELAD
jgi:ATP-binding cassette, subfamily B, bacterial